MQPSPTATTSTKPVEKNTAPATSGYLYVIIDAKGHSATAHKADDWKGESVQINGRNPAGEKVRITARELCERFNAPVIDLRGCEVEVLANEFPLCLDVFKGYKGPNGLTLQAYIRWFVNNNVKVWYPKPDGAK